MKRTETPVRVGFDTLRKLDIPSWKAILGGDPAEAARLFECAASYGLVEAQALFAQILLDGQGIGRDRARAYRWFLIAAGAKYAPAMNMVGRCLEHGWGVSKDLSEAAHWYRRAAEMSLDWAQYNLANMLLRGRGTVKDRKQALEWFVRAARQGHAKSINLVGRFLEEGWDVPQDRVAAIALYRQAAELGDFRAQFNLATWLLQQGHATQAACWLRQAAETGSADFLRELKDWIARVEPRRFADVDLIVADRLAALQAV
jgi:TPR repeat protein